MSWRRLFKRWRGGGRLRWEIASILLVKTLLLIVLINCLAVPKAQRRIGSDAAVRHLLGKEISTDQEAGHEH